MDVHETHRACERSDRIGDSQLDVCRSTLVVRYHDRVVFDFYLISHNWPPSLDVVQRSRIGCEVYTQAASERSPPRSIQSLDGLGRRGDTR
jgi:hypothetical protein